VGVSKGRESKNFGGKNLKLEFETGHIAVSSNKRSKPYANVLVKHSREEKFSFEVYSHTKKSLKWTKFK